MTKLAAERPYIRLVREENEQEDEQAIHKAVRTLNEAICTLDDEIDQKPLPMATGQTEKSRDPDASRPRVSWVHPLPDGEEVIVMAPMRVDAAAFNSVVYELIDVEKLEFEPLATRGW